MYALCQVTLTMLRQPPIPTFVPMGGPIIYCTPIGMPMGMPMGAPMGMPMMPTPIGMPMGAPMGRDLNPGYPGGAPQGQPPYNGYGQYPPPQQYPPYGGGPYGMPPGGKTSCVAFRARCVPLPGRRAPVHTRLRHAADVDGPLPYTLRRLSRDAAAHGRLSAAHAGIWRVPPAVFAPQHAYGGCSTNHLSLSRALARSLSCSLSPAFSLSLSLSLSL